MLLGEERLVYLAWPACVVLHLAVIFSFFLSFSNENEKTLAHFITGIFNHLKHVRFR